jgi:hypothetical protein
VEPLKLEHHQLPRDTYLPNYTLQRPHLVRAGRTAQGQTQGKRKVTEKDADRVYRIETDD